VAAAGADPQAANTMEATTIKKAIVLKRNMIFSPYFV
jgi:hypothetical protein